MSDGGEIPVETTEGWRPDPSRGERVLVALAAVALLGGALIVGGNLLRRDDGVSSASGSPRESVSPSVTPRAIPSPAELSLVQMSLPPAEPEPSLFSGWIRALVDLPILADPTVGSTAIGTLPAGGLVYASDQAQGSPELGWLIIEGPEPTGWVATRAGGEELVRRYRPADLPMSGEIWSLAAGPVGFVAIGSDVGRSGTYSETLFASTDGARWHVVSAPPLLGYYSAIVAWGPKGWLAVTPDNGSDLSRVWRSADGDRWTSLGVLAAGYPSAVTGSGIGYLLQTEGEEQRAWFSTDGTHWSESDPGLHSHYGVTATTAGFHARACCGPRSVANGAFSTDGRSWSHELPDALVVAVGGVLLGIESSADGSPPQALLGTFDRDGLGWRRMNDGNVPFSGAVVTSLVSDGQQATAFGWDVTTEASLTWTSDGGPWTRHLLPASFDGPPGAAAAVEGGRVVVVGNRWSSRGRNPIIWHRIAGGTWEPEGSPVLAVAPDPTAAECGPPPSDAVEFVNLDRAFAVACYGDASLTIRVWSSACDGCWGSAEGTYDEEWLAYPSSNSLYLSPVKWAGTSWGSAVLAPALAPSPDPSWNETWLELTGHFDDPAATRCHWTPPPDQLIYYGGSRQIIDGCRQQFVVTKVRVVDGP